MPIRSHVHDEVLVECAEGRAAEARAILHAAMVAGFDWSEGLPLAAEEKSRRLVHQERGRLMRSKAELRSYQVRVAAWLYERDSAIAVLDLGSGKTASALTAIADLLEAKEIRHALIVGPKRVVELVWRQEAAAWAHTAGLKIALLEGAPAARSALLACASTRQITLIGIDNVQWLVGELEKRPADDRLFDLLVIDEVSRLKSPASKRARALLSIAGRFRNRWGLTGTPRPNGEEDLFMPAAVITAGTPVGPQLSPLAAGTLHAGLQRLQLDDQAGMEGAHRGRSSAASRSRSTMPTCRTSPRSTR